MIPILRKLCLTQYRGASGVRMVDSGRAGPTAAILACTHGNEPAGLEAMDYLLSGLVLNRGRVLFIVVNPEAARCGMRYIDHNMNRLPPHPDDWAGTVEGGRLKEIRPILWEIDGGVLDLHSTSADAPPMLISVNKVSEEMAKNPQMPFTHIVNGLPAHLSGRLIVDYCSHAPIKLVAECGQHACPDAANRSVQVSLAFLRKLEMIDGGTVTAQTLAPKDYYRVVAPLRLPKDKGEFRLVKQLAPFEWVEKGQLIAESDQLKVTAPVGGYTVMCPKAEGVLDCREALLFLCKREN